MDHPVLNQLFFNHLWQSTWFAGGAALLTLALRKNRAQTRYWVWLAASVKFLIPFSLLVSIGSQVEWRTKPAIAPTGLSAVIEQVSAPFSPEVQMAACECDRTRSVAHAIADRN